MPVSEREEQTPASRGAKVLLFVILAICALIHFDAVQGIYLGAFQSLLQKIHTIVTLVR